VTRLDRFIKQAGVKPSRLAERAGVSRQHLLRLRRGQMEPTRRMMVALADAASQMCRRTVYTVELFELSHGDESRQT
jgi:transcriptional regulator with XRE-family HTH domain